jgi:hypothetical protein
LAEYMSEGVRPVSVITRYDLRHADGAMKWPMQLNGLMVGDERTSYYCQSKSYTKG